MCSLLSITPKGEAVEIAMVGNDGVVGIEGVLREAPIPYRVVVQIAVSAQRVPMTRLRTEFNESARVRDLLLQYTHSLLSEIAQSAVCHRFHTASQRFARWLLIARDRVNSDTVELTQEFIAHMLGIPRTGVTMAAGGLQEAGLIRQRHGRIQILDRRGLEAAACECYRIVKHGNDR